MKESRNQNRLLQFVSVGILLVFTTLPAYSQSLDSLLHKVDPQKWSAVVEKKVSKLEDKTIAKSEKILRQLQKRELKIWRKQLNTKDSLLAKTNLAQAENLYKEVEEKFKTPATLLNCSQGYLPHADTILTAFKFLGQHGMDGNLTKTISKIKSFQNKMQQAEGIKRFLKARREQLRQQLEEFGLVKDLKKFNKELFYYIEEVNQYQQLFNDPEKIEKKAIELLRKTKIFQDFMRKNSVLASMFNMPGNSDNTTFIPSLVGLQTRRQVTNLIQQQVSAGGPNAQSQLQQNIRQGQSQLQDLKNNILRFDGGSSDNISPEGFKPNHQKTKTFFQRLEYGTNIQTQRTNNFFPVTTDLGLSLGYKLNDKSAIGIGASYKLGWGKTWSSVRLTHEGAGLRSYIDCKLKGSFWISGGYEMNYRTAFNSIAQLKSLDPWQKSGLIGLSKVVSVKAKVFKKTRVQLLWDFLSYTQKPQTPSLNFRIGYNF